MTASNLTILWGPHPTLRKSFFLNEDGSLSSQPTLLPTELSCQHITVANIDALGQEITELSAHGNAMLIHGSNPGLDRQFVRRTKENFPEPEEGIHWVMLDFDNVDAPADCVPYSIDAIHYLISRLPAPFHGVTCFFQHSASAGIVDRNGQLRKSGINAHLFFMFRCPVSGKKLVAYLKQHSFDQCIAAIRVSNGGVPSVDYGFDPCVIDRPVQPHYIAAPLIGEGVRCLLADADRQGFIRADRSAVELPAIADDLAASVQRQHREMLDVWRQENGYTRTTSIIRTGNSFASTPIWQRQGEPARTDTGRVFVGGELQDEGRRFVLQFDDENSSGSWRVFRSTPQIARHYGGESMALQELSPSAYAHVRDELGWFSEVSQHSLGLQEGRLPTFEFATAKHCLIEAPTGSGKTTRAKDFIRACRHPVIYVAPTIALCRQAEQDFGAEPASLQVAFYQDINAGTPLRRMDVVVTTTESLSKSLDLFAADSIRFSLIIDEIHIALDSVNASDNKQQVFRDAIARAEKTLYLTGTITPLQVQTLAQATHQILGHSDEDDFCHYRFKSERSNPLALWSAKSFESEFIKLLQSLQAKLQAGEALPRVVIILPTSKMKVYQALLVAFGLIDQAHIVSRQESTEEEIEAARTSTQPILISSSLFSTGLNFAREADSLWCHFDHMQVDMSAIQQTLNRANRDHGRAPCAVRIYVSSLSQEEFHFPAPADVEAELRDFIGEGEFIRGLDLPRTLNRMSYNAMRDIEKNTSKALGLLIRQNSFQNYRLASLELQGGRDRAMEDVFSSKAKEAKAAYDEAIQTYMSGQGTDPDTIFIRLDRINAEARSGYQMADNRTPRDIENEKKGLLLSLVQAQGSLLHHPTTEQAVRVLFAKREPHVLGWNSSLPLPKAELVAQVEGVVALIDNLEKMKLGHLDGHQFAANLNRNKVMQCGIVGLVSSEGASTAFLRRFKKLAELSEKRRTSNTQKNQKKLDNFALTLTADVLGPIGVTFPVKNLPGVGRRTMYGEPYIPPSWDFDQIRQRLDRYIETLKSLPQGCPSFARLGYGDPSSVAEQGHDIQHCISCKRLFDGACVLGRPIVWDAFGIENRSECDDLIVKCNELQSRCNASHGEKKSFDTQGNQPTSIAAFPSDNCDPAETQPVADNVGFGFPLGDIGFRIPSDRLH